MGSKSGPNYGSAEYQQIFHALVVRHIYFSERYYGRHPDEKEQPLKPIFSPKNDCGCIVSECKLQYNKYVKDVCQVQGLGSLGISSNQ